MTKSTGIVENQSVAMQQQQNVQQNAASPSSSGSGSHSSDNAKKNLSTVAKIAGAVIASLLLAATVQFALGSVRGEDAGRDRAPSVAGPLEPELEQPSLGGNVSAKVLAQPPVSEKDVSAPRGEVEEREPEAAPEEAGKESPSSSEQEAERDQKAAIEEKAEKEKVSQKGKDPVSGKEKREKRHESRSPDASCCSEGSALTSDEAPWWRPMRTFFVVFVVFLVGLAFGAKYSEACKDVISPAIPHWDWNDPVDDVGEHGHVDAPSGNGGCECHKFLSAHHCQPAAWQIGILMQICATFIGTSTKITIRKCSLMEEDAQKAGDKEAEKTAKRLGCCSTN